MSDTKDSAGASAIIVGIDFSQTSRHALEEAVRIAKLEKAKLVICHFLYDEEMAHLIRWVGLTADAVLAGRGSHLCAWIDELEMGDLEWDTRIEIGHPFASLIKTIKEENAILLILGAHGESHQTQANQIGAVARSCLRYAPCEVLLIRNEHTGPFRTVLAAIDFSENSKAAIHRAAEIAESEFSELHVIHIFAPAWKYFGERDEVTEDVENYIGEIRGQFSDFVYPELSESKQLPLHFDVRESLSVYHGILDYAAEVNADLIVVGLQGRGSTQSSAPGSTAERIIEKSSCSVLTVPPELSNP